VQQNYYLMLFVTGIYCRRLCEWSKACDWETLFRIWRVTQNSKTTPSI